MIEQPKNEFLKYDFEIKENNICDIYQLYENVSSFST